MIDKNRLQKSASLTDVKPYLKELLLSEKYEEIWDSITYYCNEKAEVNKSWSKQNLFQYLIPLTLNYFISSRLTAGQMKLSEQVRFIEWAKQFRKLAESSGFSIDLDEIETDEDKTWEAFLNRMASHNREGLRRAIEVIDLTMKLFLAEFKNKG